MNKRTYVLIGCLLFSMRGPVSAQQASHAQHGEMSDMPAVTGSPTQVRLSDIEFTNRDGRKLRLVSDVFADKVAIIDFVYTSCTTICPVLTGVMQVLQKELAACLDGHVALVSITVDPNNDDAATLQQYASKAGADDAWYWLTGTPGNIDRALKGFGLPTGEPEDHPAIMLIGKGGQEQWLRWVGIPAPGELAQAVQVLLHGESTCLSG